MDTTDVQIPVYVYQIQGDSYEVNIENVDFVGGSAGSGIMTYATNVGGRTVNIDNCTFTGFAASHVLYNKGNHLNGPYTIIRRVTKGM